MNRDEAERWYQERLDEAIAHTAWVRGMTRDWDAEDKQAWLLALRKEWERRLGRGTAFTETDLQDAWDFAIEDAHDAMRDHFQMKREEAEARAAYDRED